MASSEQSNEPKHTQQDDEHVARVPSRLLKSQYVQGGLVLANHKADCQQVKGITSVIAVPGLTGKPSEQDIREYAEELVQYLNARYLFKTDHFQTERIRSIDL